MSLNKTLRTKVLKIYHKDNTDEMNVMSIKKEEQRSSNKKSPIKTPEARNRNNKSHELARTTVYLH